MRPAPLSFTPTLLSPTHPDSESTTVAALPKALAQWTGLKLPPDGWCLCGRACMGWSSSPCLRVKRHLPLSTPAGRLLSFYPCFFLSLAFPPRELGPLWAVQCWVLFSRCCQLSLRPAQDKAVIAPGIAGLSSSSSKQICCNFICNWALNWEQIEAAL